jgi:hypothetical protein
VTGTHGSLGVLRHEELNGMFTVFAGCAEQMGPKNFITWLCTPNLSI